MSEDKNRQENAFETIDKSTGKKIIYIMADKSCEKYAHKLQTLISAKHDVKCCIYTKEVYKANMSKVTSDNIIVFIGENDISTAALPNVKNQAPEDYGLFYGWHGKRAKISVMFKIAGYQKHKDFINYYNKLCTNFEEEIKIYNIKDFAMIAAFGLIGLMVRTIANLTIDNKLLYNACIMEFFKNGLDNFIKGTCDG